MEIILLSWSLLIADTNRIYHLNTCQVGIGDDANLRNARGAMSAVCNFAFTGTMKLVDRASPDFCANVLKAISNGGRTLSPLVPTFAAMLESPNAKVRFAAARCMNASRSEDAIPPMLTQVRKEQHPLVLYELLRVYLLNEHDPRLAASSEMLLLKLGNHRKQEYDPADIRFYGWSGVISPEFYFDDRVISALVYSGPEVIPSLTKALDKKDSTVAMKIGSARALGGIMESFSRSDAKKATMAARKVMSALTRHLDTRDERLAVAVIMSLGKVAVAARQPPPGGLADIAMDETRPDYIRRLAKSTQDRIAENRPVE